MDRAHIANFLACVKSRATPDLLAVEVSAHYALGRVVQPPSGGGPPMTPPPATIPDIRSLFLGFYYNFAKLPDTPMHPRVADDRVGYFVTSRFDFADDWWHQVNVEAVEQKTPSGKYPRVTKKVGKSPPQYADLDE